MTDRNKEVFVVVQTHVVRQRRLSGMMRGMFWSIIIEAALGLAIWGGIHLFRK